MNFNNLNVGRSDNNIISSSVYGLYSVFDGPTAFLWMKYSNNKMVETLFNSLDIIENKKYVHKNDQFTIENISIHNYLATIKCMVNDPEDVIQEYLQFADDNEIAIGAKLPTEGESYAYWTI